MKHMALVLAVWISGLAGAFAQTPVKVIGSITPGDCAQFNSPTIVKDAGFNCNGSPAVVFANPSAAVGLSTVNGSATSAMRSDASPALSSSVQTSLTGTNNALLIGTGAFGIASTTTGTGVLTALGIAVNASGGIVTPTPTRAGDVVYWNGSAWVTLAGNNSGTQILTENSSGVPSWAATGSVSSVTCGTGLSGGTITTTGTCAVSLTTASNVLGGDVALSSTSTYFDGPSMAQGTSGTWFASGTVTLADPSAGGNFNCKLWDGTTVIASARTTNPSTVNTTISLHGILATPAANIRISCEDSANTTGAIKFNASGNSKDSAIFGFRIQ